MDDLPQTVVHRNTVMHLVTASPSKVIFEPHYSRFGTYKVVFECPRDMWVAETPFAKVDSPAA